METSASAGQKREERNHTHLQTSQTGNASFSSTNREALRFRLGLGRSSGYTGSIRETGNEDSSDGTASERLEDAEKRLETGRLEVAVATGRDLCLYHC